MELKWSRKIKKIEVALPLQILLVNVLILDIKQLICVVNIKQNGYVQ
ncbi:hypothetical protein SDC9_125016 [bioreactor metagenome]|uniref:Uncharacterized protein n=1 Tax=bioreactor metagenome TaxID=1076179 RepID=A0A645CLW3_9ZZZZ